MLTSILRFILGLLNTESIAFAVATAESAYQESLAKAADNRSKALDRASTDADKTMEALGAVLFVAGQQLAVVDRAKEAIAKARAEGVK